MSVRQFTHGSLFAGIEGFGLGFRNAGYRTVWAVEKEPFCQAVIKTHFPEVEIHSDVNEVGKHNLRSVDVLTAGFPCQDLSVAGKRAGLGGARSGLFWQAHRIIGELQPAWVVIENVPGLFSSNSGRDFAVLLRGLDELGYGLAWRVLDSQFFGVAQRRRRVFIVGCLGRPCPPEVLFESEGGEGDFAESGETWEGVTREVTGSVGGVGRSGGFSPNAEQAAGGFLQITPTLNAGMGHHGWACGDQDFKLLQPISVRLAQTSSNGWGISEDGRTHTLDGTGGDAIAFAENQRGEIRTSDIAMQLNCSGGKPGSGYPAVAFTLPSVHRGLGNGHNTNYVPTASLSGMGSGGPDDNDGQARRIIECAPSDSNRVRNPSILPEGMDSARYRALGNAVTANVAQWIAERITAYESRK